MQSLALPAAAAALLAACPPSLIPQWIQDVNTLVGLIGFSITLVVWWQVKNGVLLFLCAPGSRAPYRSVACAPGSRAGH